MFKPLDHVRSTARWALSVACIASGWRRRCVARYGGGLALCVFSHNPSLKVMEQTVGWLVGHGFRFVSQHQLQEAVAGRKRLPDRSVWLSFDDGWRDNLWNVVPVLEREGIPATFFLAPGATELGFVWTDAGLRKGDLSWGEMVAMPNGVRKEYVWRLIGEGYGVPRRLMTAEQIAGLARNSLFSFENHTWSHAAATSCAVDELLEEVAVADRKIAEWTGRKTSMLCYPFGMWSAPLDASVTRAGWMTVSSDPGGLAVGPNGAGRRPIPRNLFYDDRSLAENSCRLVGAWRRIQAGNQK